MKLVQLSLLDAQTIGAPHNGTETSVAAAKAAAPRVGTDKRRILDVFELRGDWTQDEIALHLFMPRSTVCARMNELEREGYVRKTNATRQTQYGRMAAVYRLAEGEKA